MGLTLGQLSDRIDKAIADLGRLAPVHVSDPETAYTDSHGAVLSASPLGREFWLVIDGMGDDG